MKAAGVPVTDHAMLACYGPDLAESPRKLATYRAQSSKTPGPESCKLEQLSKYESVIKLKTAKALKLAIPKSLLLRADKVIR